MEEQLNNIVEKIYKLRKNFVIIGLTGRTGCTSLKKVVT